MVLFWGTSAWPGSSYVKTSPQPSRVGILTTHSTEGEPEAQRSAGSRSSKPMPATETHAWGVAS